jgi:hypothetical protein
MKSEHREPPMVATHDSAAFRFTDLTGYSINLNGLYREFNYKSTGSLADTKTPDNYLKRGKDKSEESPPSPVLSYVYVFGPFKHHMLAFMVNGSHSGNKFNFSSMNTEASDRWHMMYLFGLCACWTGHRYGAYS